MDKNALLIGGAVVVIGGAIATSILLNSPKQDNPFKDLIKENNINNDSEKAESFYFEELEDKDKYTFCIGKESIKGVYTNSVFGNEKGDVDYTSDDISVFDKQKNKLYILGRRISYTYSGNAEISAGSGQGNMEITESGTTYEYYKKNSAPVRIDYNSKIISPAPERKSTEWVVATIKSRGTIMGLTQEDIRQENGDAKVFCSSFNFDGDLLAKGAIITPEYFSFKDRCPQNSPNPGVSFSGDFNFECNNIDNKQGIEMIKEYQAKEALYNAVDSAEDNVDGNEIKDAVEQSNSNQSPEDINGKLEELRREMKDGGSVHEQ